MTNKKEIQKEQKELRIILNEWDPIGGCPEDEYDDLRDSLISLLHKNTKTENIELFVSKHLVEYAGIESNKEETKEETQKIINWWNNRKK